MNTLTQPLRDEHKELLPHIENILKVAESLPDAPVEQIRQGVKQVYDFLAYHLIPHAQAEDAALYPAVQKAMGSPDATRTMSRDHVEVGRYVDELADLNLAGDISARTVKALQRVPGEGPFWEGRGSISPDSGGEIIFRRVEGDV